MVQKTYIQSIQANQSSQRISQIKAALNHSYISTTQKNPINNSNGYRRPNQIDDTKQQQSINLLKLPGCNRQLMPKHPTRSAALRLQRRSRLTPFVTGNFKDFQLQLSLVYFQNMLRQQPEQRSYDLGQFYHMQRLTQNRLRNKLYNILKLQPTVISKYNQKEDRLYLILYQRTPKGRTLRKGWQNQWSVLPNFESWIKYFKNNQQNFNKQTFFDLDLRKYGRHSDRLKVCFPAQKNTILFVRQLNLGNSINHSTWINKNELEFGINQKGFWAQVQGVKVTTQYKDRKWSLSIQTKHGNIIIILPGCSIYQKHYKYKNLISCKTLLSGHIIIYGKERKIIHPGGQLTIGRPFQVINKKGLGVKQQNSSLTQWPTVTRCLNGISFSKRQDGSKITIKGQQQWNQFENFKMHKIGQILHIQRQQFSSYTVKINNRIEAKLGKLKLSASNQSQGQLFQVQLPDKTWLSLKNNNISLRPQDQSNLYSIDLSTKQIIFEDSQHNVFRVDAQGKCNCIFSNPIIYNQDQKRPNTPPFQVKQYIQEQVQSLPLPALQIQPRLFIVEGNGTGIEFHNKNLLLEQGIRINKQSCIDSQKEQQININQVKQDMLKQKSVMQIPRIKDLDLLKLTQKTQKQQTKHNYIVLQQTKGKQFLDREPFRKTLSEYFQWKKQFIKSYNQFGHIKRQQAQQKTDHAIMSKIMEFRQRHKQPKGTSMDFLESVQLFQNYLVQQQKKKKAQQQANRVQQKIQEQQPKIIKKSRPDRQNNQESISKIKGQFFAANYFQTNAGQQFLKNNPGMPSSKKIVKPILQAPQDISKIQAAAQQPQQSEPAQQISKFQSKQQNIQSIILKPSVFTKAQIDQQRRQLQQQKACYKARQLRHKQYDVYQQPRKDIPIPFSVLRSNPKSQLNQKYILTQTITDRKIKISSMKNKISTKSPSTQQQRAQGSHHPLMKTFDKKYQYQELLDRKPMMIQADINDRLRRDVLIYPTQAEFGRLKVGCLYQIKISIKNQDSISQRIHISQIKNPNIHVCLSRTGPIALGINTEVIIRIQANESARGKFSQEFQIITKHQIYQIPVRGIIVPEQVYDRQQKEERMAGLSQSKGFVKLIGNLNQNSEYSILPKLKKEQPQYL